MTDSRRSVAVLFGGRSLEHDVSIVSGLQALHALDPERFTPVPVYIDTSGHWWTGDPLWHNESFKGAGPNRAALAEVMLAPGFGTSALLSVGGWPSAVAKARPIDVFLPILHGTFGEDGCLQGLLELGGCAYVGCGVAASAIGMNKRLTKMLATHAGVPVLPWRSYDRAVLERGADWIRELPGQIAGAFGWPVIVKPCSLGSSAGVSVVASPSELTTALLEVFACDLEAIVEQFVKNRLEVNVAVAGLDEPVASVTEMPVTAQASPLSFSEKYKRDGRKSVGSEGMAGASRVLDPDALPLEVRERARRYASTVFALLGCEGISRVDFLIDTDAPDADALYFNEINTLPGSLAYYLWSAVPHHWTITELLTKLIDRAVHQHAVKMGLERKPPAELRLLA